MSVTGRAKKDWFTSTDSTLGEEYEAKAVRDHLFFVKVKSHRFMGIVEQHMGDLNQLTCLDIGCGTGETAVWLSPHFREVHGVDYARGMIASARKRKLPNCTFEVADSTHLNYEDNSFDTAVFFNVLHHVESRRTLLSMLLESRRVVRDGGLLVITELNPYNPVTRHVVNTIEIDKAVILDGYGHGVFPTTLKPSECADILRATGWAVAEMEFMVFFPQALSFLLPMERLLKRLPLGGLYLVAARKGTQSA